MNHDAALQAPPWFNRRLLVAMGAVVGAFSLLLARAWYLQVAHYDNYQALAENNRITMVPLPPPRGRILDRNGVVLAEDIYTPSLEIAPDQARNIDALLAELRQIIPLSTAEVRSFKRLLAVRKNSSGTVPLKTRLSDQQAALIAAERYRLDGVEIKARPHRHYPLGTSAAHAIGHIGRISVSDNDWLTKNNLSSNYAGSTHIGKLGLESSYERELHGITGIEEVEITAAGRPVRSLSKQQATPGQNLRLSIDIRLQQMAEKLYGQYKGALVAIEPATGDVLAFVSMPSFDPNLFVDGINKRDWQKLNTDPARPLLNRPLRGTYPPGSTYKPFMALAVLENRIRKPEDSIQDPGYFMLGKHRFRDSKPQGHGRVNLMKSIVVSSDTYYYQASYELGVDRIHQFMQPWGFGSLTGIDLPDETPGILPSRQWKEQRFKQPWYPGETPSIGIGQGYNAFTILQLAHATATLANNAVPVRPHLVTHVGNRSLRDSAISAQKPLDINRRHLALVQQAMRDVTVWGTARIAFAGAEYQSAGKTGTSQVIGIGQKDKYDEKRIAQQHRDHSLYIGYAPYESPKIALAMIVENGGFGARTAAPIARQLFDFYLLGKEPVIPEQPAPAAEPEPLTPPAQIRVTDKGAAPAAAGAGSATATATASAAKAPAPAAKAASAATVNGTAAGTTRTATAATTTPAASSSTRTAASARSTPATRSATTPSGTAERPTARNTATASGDKPAPAAVAAGRRPAAPAEASAAATQAPAARNIAKAGDKARTSAAPTSSPAPEAPRPSRSGISAETRAAAAAAIAEAARNRSGAATKPASEAKP